MSVRQDLKHIKSNVEWIRESSDGTTLSYVNCSMILKDLADQNLIEEEFYKILDWFVTTDPSPNHNSACQLHEPHTGK